MTLELLRETMIGKTVHDAKKKYSADNKLFDEAKSIIAVWKRTCDVPSSGNDSKTGQKVEVTARKSSRESKPVPFEIELPKSTYVDVKVFDKVKPTPERNIEGYFVP